MYVERYIYNVIVHTMLTPLTCLQLRNICQSISICMITNMFKYNVAMLNLCKLKAQRIRLELGGYIFNNHFKQL